MPKWELVAFVVAGLACLAVFALLAVEEVRLRRGEREP